MKIEPKTCLVCVSLAVAVSGCASLSGTDAPNTAYSQGQDGTVRSNQAAVATNTTLGHFNLSRDLFVAHHDTGADLDDVYAMAAEGTMLRDRRFAGVRYYAVTGTCTRGYKASKIDAKSVLELAFPGKWSSAFEDWKGSVAAESALVIQTLKGGGDVWLMEGGASDFTADVLRKASADYPAGNLKRIHVVQHSLYNQNKLTTPSDLAYVKERADYIKVPDGGGKFVTTNSAWWPAAKSHPKDGPLWTAARSLADRWNGKTEYTNPALAKGGFDFSDSIEMAYIFGFDNLPSVDAFFTEFLK
jgi:hypothetical protein